MVRFDPLYNPYPSRRMTVYAKNGMVATSHPLAAQAGLDMLKRGGNAVDAAVAAAACLTVVEPTANGIGGDAFALVWSKGRLYGLNASGPAPQALSIEKVLHSGDKSMSRYGWLPVTVPGVPAAWAALAQRFGRLPLTAALEPAVNYGENGCPVSPVAGYYWQKACSIYRANLKGEEFAHWFATFAPEGRPPGIGEIWRSPGHAASLRLIAETNAEAFYRGELAEAIDRFARKTGGLITKADLAAFEPEWVDPISVNYRGYDVWELPPNGQGLVALLALKILEQYQDLAQDDPETYHRQIEAVKLAFADGRTYITDPREMQVKVEDLLSEAYARRRQRLISDTAMEPACGKPPQGGTVYLAVADNQGNMVSYIQSNYMGFGSGIVIPGTGIALQNRGHTFSLDPSHANCLKPGKRTYHTIIPGFLTKGGQPIGPFGVMGGFMQPQGHVQVIVNTVDFELNPQAALDAPRWQWVEGRKVEVESTVPNHIARALDQKGHQVNIALTSGGFGRGQIIWRMPDGVLAGGTEPRTDGTIASF
ncbi:MAG: gamma-glutamyltransferase family protein [Firmicutes bacterium]|nr:gamma-glutamyltransferase family protein [Bacillota bacterium]NLL89114.1 gamma-glutamyltransferase family protein [Bacillota bacterium]